MADVTLTYKGSTIGELSESGNKTLKTAGKYCDADILLEYAKPEGIDYLRKSALGQTVDKITYEDVTNVGDYVFAGIKTKEFDLPNVLDIGTYGMAYTPIEKAFFPKAKIGQGCFQGCSSLTVVVCEGLTGYTQCGDCRALRAFDGINITNNFNYTFNNCTSLQTVILRRNDAITPLQSTATFTSSPFKNGGTGGTIYIPKALFDHLGDGTALDYKSAFNWSTIDGYGTITWAQIEGSQYETHYADGTEIS